MGSLVREHLWSRVIFLRASYLGVGLSRAGGLGMVSMQASRELRFHQDFSGKMQHGLISGSVAVYG